MKKENFLWADTIRVFACIAVIFIHVSDISIRKYGQISSLWWHTSNIYLSLSRIAVPLFVMLSGALILEKKETLKQFFTKRFRRVLVPFLFWSVIFILYRISYHNEHLTISDIIDKIIKGTPYFHFWYIYMILGLYLFTPVLRIFAANATRKEQLYLILTAFTINSVLPALETFTGFKTGIWTVNFQSYIDYFLLGYFLKNTKITRKIFNISVIAALLSGIFTIIGTAVTVKMKGRYDELFLGYHSWNVFIEATAVFIIIKYLSDKSHIKADSKISEILSILSASSFGIYIIHIIPIEIFKNKTLGITISPIVMNPLYSIPLISLIVFIICASIIYLIRKIPYLKETV